jgi:hypothetical protein
MRNGGHVRYRAVNSFLWQELELSELYCSAPEGLNDVFDCRLEWRGSFERALMVEGIDGRRREQLKAMRAAFEQAKPTPALGLCCFTAKADDHLMWAHYADAHRGVCLMYDLPVDYVGATHKRPDEFFMLAGVPVIYGDNAFFDWLATGDLDGPPIGDPVINAVTRTLNIKASNWAYEEEFRILMSRPGRLTLEPAFLAQVTFGINTSDEHRRMITRIAKRSNQNVKIAEVKRSRSSDFGLDFPDMGQDRLD